MIEIEALLEDRHATRGQCLDIGLGGLRIQRNQDLGVGLAGNISVLAGADQKPGWKSGNVGGKEVLPADGNTHSEDALQQDVIGGLRTGAVHRCYADAEIVYDARSRAFCALWFTQGKANCRHVAGFPSNAFWKALILRSDVIIVTRK